MSAEASLQDRVRKELATVRLKGLARLDSLDSGTPLLDAAVANVVDGYTKLPRSSRVALLLQREISQIRSPQREWLDVLFGFGNDLDSSHPTELRKKAADLAGDEYFNFIRRKPPGKEWEALAALAAQIIADCPDLGAQAQLSTPLQPSTAERPVPDPDRTVAERASKSFTDHQRQLLPLADDELRQALNWLAAEVQDRLCQQEGLRRERDPFLLPVSWSNAPEWVHDDWEKIRGERGNNEGIDLAGSIEAIGVLLDRVPSRRLVIVGDGGSGKTTIISQLALSLITPESVAAGMPVPVVLPLFSWNPMEREFRSWLVERLALEYPYLGRRTPREVTFAEELVAGGRILPLLDGFDELPVGSRASALRSLNRSSVLAAGCVLATRPHEYFYALESGHLLYRAATIGLNSLDPEDIAEYLPLSASGENRAKWATVVDSMRRGATEADKRLQEVLSLPLMVSLVRDIYATGERDPTELLDRGRHATPEQLIGYLLGEFVKAAYEDSARPARIREAQVGRWLKRLAVEQYAINRPDAFTWDHLYLWPRGSVAAWGIFISSAAISAAYFLSTGVQTRGWVLSVAAIVTFLFGALGAMGKLEGDLHRRPNRIAFRLESARPRAMLRRFFSYWHYRGGVGVALHAGFWVTASTILLLIAPLAAIVFAVCMVLAVKVSRVLVSIFTRPIEAEYADAPVSTLELSRRAMLLEGALAAVVGILVVGSAYLLPFDLQAPLVPLLSVGVLLMTVRATLDSPWGMWVQTRMNLALTGALPWGVLDFLEDARRRGVVRRVGDTYQFRHRMLCDYLADEALRALSTQRSKSGRFLLARLNLILGREYPQAVELQEALEVFLQEVPGGWPRSEPAAIMARWHLANVQVDERVITQKEFVRQCEELRFPAVVSFGHWLALEIWLRAAWTKIALGELESARADALRMLKIASPSDSYGGTLEGIAWDVRELLAEVDSLLAMPGSNPKL